MPNPNSPADNDIDPTHAILKGDSPVPAKKPTKAASPAPAKKSTKAASPAPAKMPTQAAGPAAATQPTKDDYAKAIIAEGQKRGISPRGIEIALATALVESNLTMYANESDPDSLKFPHQALSTDANSSGLFQQRAPWWGTAQCRMDAACSAGMFYDHLAKLPYNDPSKSPGSFAQAVQQSAFPDRYDQRMSDATALYNRLVQKTGTAPATNPNAPRPDFNEYPKWCDNNQSRGGTTIDLWLIHTQEGGGGDNAADDLANFLISTTGGPNPVSYHYTISQASDGGVTVVDCVDTDLAAWAVLDANDRSINLCFAGSTINWSTDQWMQQSKAIDVAAYLCIQDCVKYGISPKVIVPPYTSDPPGISDHKYVTQHLGSGTHTDVGPNFPWPYFQQRIAFWNQALTTTGPPPTPDQPDHPVVPYDPTQNPSLETLTQVRGRWGRLGKRTLVEAVGVILDKVTGEDNSKDDSFSW